MLPRGALKEGERKAEPCPHAGTVAPSGARLGGGDVSVTSPPGEGPWRGPSSCLHCVHVFSQPRSWYRTCETTQVPFLTVVSGKTKGIQKERMWG